MPFREERLVIALGQTNFRGSATSGSKLIEQTFGVADYVVVAPVTTNIPGTSQNIFLAYAPKDYPPLLFPNRMVTSRIMDEQKLVLSTPSK